MTNFDPRDQGFPPSQNKFVVMCKLVLQCHLKMAPGGMPFLNFSFISLRFTIFNLIGHLVYRVC